MAELPVNMEHTVQWEHTSAVCYRTWKSIQWVHIVCIECTREFHLRECNDFVLFMYF